MRVGEGQLWLLQSRVRAPVSVVISLATLHQLTSSGELPSHNIMDEKNEKKIGDPSIEVGGEILSMKMISKIKNMKVKYVGNLKSMNQPLELEELG